MPSSRFAGRRLCRGGLKRDPFVRMSIKLSDGGFVQAQYGPLPACRDDEAVGLEKRFKRRIRHQYGPHSLCT